MADIKIAVMVENMRMDFREAVKLVRTWGVVGAQIGAPLHLDSAGRKELVSFMDGEGVAISAICAWGGEVDLCEKEGLEGHIETAFRLLDLAAELGCKIWQGHVGIMPWEPVGERWETLMSAIQPIARHGEEVGAVLAMETGPEPPAVLKRVIETVGSPTLRINYDPANFILWPPMLASRDGVPYDKEKAIADFMPNEGVNVIGDYVVHTHAKDALVLEDGTPLEVPLGEGWVDWPRYIGLLKQHGFEGYSAIEREVGADPVKNIREAVDFLRTV
jgi:sugar phosphate isomerase/epimerase